jgi:hypothetical protein
MVVERLCDPDVDKRALAKARAKLNELGHTGAVAAAGVALLVLLSIAMATVCGPPGLLWALVIAPRQWLRKAREQLRDLGLDEPTKRESRAVGSCANRRWSTWVVGRIEVTTTYRDTSEPDGHSREELVEMLATVRRAEAETGWRVPEPGAGT